MLAQVTGKEAISRRLPRCDRTVPTGAAATTLGSAFVVKLLSARSARPGIARQAGGRYDQGKEPGAADKMRDG